jgi:YbbR domain-containing protein
MGDPREGYELAGWIVSPKTVEVTGPRSLVDRTKRARAAMDLMGVFPDVAVAVDARALDSGGSPVEGVMLTPPKVNVQVRMTLAVVPRTVPVFLRTSGTLAPGLEITSVRVEPSLVTILGAANRVEEVDYVETSELPLRAVQRSFMRELSLVVPNGVTLLTDPMVMVSAKVKQVEPPEQPPAAPPAAAAPERERPEEPGS